MRCSARSTRFRILDHRPQRFGARDLSSSLKRPARELVDHVVDEIDGLVFVLARLAQSRLGQQRLSAPARTSSKASSIALRRADRRSA